VRCHPPCLRQRASQAVAYASKQAQSRCLVRPALTASSRQACSHCQPAVSGSAQLFVLADLNPGSMPATEPSRLAHLEDAAMTGANWDHRATRDLLKSFGWAIAATPSLDGIDSCHFLAARPIGALSRVHPA